MGASDCLESSLWALSKLSFRFPELLMLKTAGYSKPIATLLWVLALALRCLLAAADETKVTGGDAESAEAETGGMSKTMMIGIGIGVVVLICCCCVCCVCLGGGG